MKNNDIKNKEKDKDSDNSSYRGIYFETEIDAMDPKARPLKTNTTKTITQP